MSDKSKHEFLCQALTFGHLKVVSMVGTQPLSLEELELAVGDQQAGRWLCQLLRARIETHSERLSFLRLAENSYDHRLHRLFFSEEKLFQYYWDAQNFPLSQGNAARIAIVTALPDRLLELAEPPRFWDKLAITPFVEGF